MPFLVVLIRAFLIAFVLIKSVLLRKETRTQILRKSQLYRISTTQYGDVTFAFDDDTLHKIRQGFRFCTVHEQDLILLFKTLVHHDLRVVESGVDIA